MMQTADFHFDLPPELIAQKPSPKRDQSRLLVLHRESGWPEHRKFRDLLEILHPGDVLVLNNSRVIPARLHGANRRTGGAFEILLLEENATNDWWVMLKPGRRARVGTQIRIIPRGWCNGARAESRICARVVALNDEGHRRVHFDGVSSILAVLDEIGEVPLPPYIHRKFAAPGFSSQHGVPVAEASHEFDRERYQTVFAQTAGSVAAPTAGLHFTKTLLDEIHARGVELRFVTLHVGLATFAPVKTETPAAHKMHEERFEVSEATARSVNEAKAEGRRVVAVGTTTVRVLESVARENRGQIVAGSGRTRIFIHPPFNFKVVDALLTNFHLPYSTLLMLVSAFADPGGTRGRNAVLSAYAEAIRSRYRFFSYGDAMLVL